ncbi:MAG: magnesium/cobalt transporter CorA [Candidatus Wildermuthbacteria bacterium]|nr:magnesium/cobalt transporter CorA [Candidatus Wildermuthbacteria bacterium]
MVHSYFLENGKLVAKPGYSEDCQWLNIEGVGNEEIALLKKLGFHELAIEDILHGGQRMKTDDYKDYLFLTASTIELGVIPLNFYCFLSKERIVTVASRELRGDNEVVKRCQKNPDSFSRGPDFILYLFLDYIADEYFPLLDNLDEELDAVEKKLLSQSIKEPVTKLLTSKRKVIIFRKNLVALRDLALALRQFEGKFISVKNIPYFQDVFDHLVRLSDKTDLMRDIVTTTFEGYLTILSNNLNEVMKRLTALTVILMVPTLIAGIYGMNFTFLPGSNNRFGLYGILGLMGFLIIVSVCYFKKKKWL